MRFATLIDEVKKLSREEKEELQHLVEQYLIEEKREQYLKSYQDSLEEEAKGLLSFSSNLSELKKKLK